MSLGTRDSGLGHAVGDPRSRLAKARKIERLLGLDAPDAGAARLLEVGTGSGAIAEYFARHAAHAHTVAAVDVVDARAFTDGYAFTRTDGERLPFADASFDVVVSNHVIEHVGDAAARARHLVEIARVLTADGRAYLAVPSRWMPVEPHYHLAFLSWLPRPLRSPYLRLRGRGAIYDCNPPGPRELERQLRAAGFDFRQHTGDAVRAMVALEGPGSLVRRGAAALPDAAWRALRHALPTLIYTLRKAPGP